MLAQFEVVSDNSRRSARRHWQLGDGLVRAPATDGDERHSCVDEVAERPTNATLSCVTITPVA